MKRPKKMKALIVDDEQELAAMVAQRLRSAGFDAALAGDGRSGYERALSWLPDVVLVDLSMPDLDGWQLCQALNDDERTAAIPKVIMTAWVTADLQRRAKEVCAAGIITKPFDEKALAAKIRSLARSSARRARLPLGT